MSNSAFRDWFIEQHGTRCVANDVSDDDLLEEVKLGKTAEAELERRRFWDAKFNSALYAWQARGTPSTDDESYKKKMKDKMPDYVDSILDATSASGKDDL